MPNRMMREQALMSADLAAVSAGAERLFWRLILVADDHGIFVAEPIAVHGRCLPLFPVVTTEVVSWLEELAGVALICLYEMDRRHYGHFPSWSKHQRVRAEKSKYPLHEGACESLRSFVSKPPTNGSNGRSNAPVVGVEDVDEDGVEVGHVSAECGHETADVPAEWKDLRVKAWLGETKHLKHLADDRYAGFWSTLENGFDQYPFVYFDEEIRRFDAWLEANPAKRPARNWRRKVHNWFAKAV